MSRKKDLHRMEQLIHGFEELGVVPPYPLDTAKALDDENLHEAVVATGRRLVFVQKALDEQ